MAEEQQTINRPYRRLRAKINTAVAVLTSNQQCTKKQKQSRANIDQCLDEIGTPAFASFKPYAARRFAPRIEPPSALASLGGYAITPAPSCAYERHHHSLHHRSPLFASFAVKPFGKSVLRLISQPKRTHHRLSDAHYPMTPLLSASSAFRRRRS